jgi:hypothetical protein
MTADQIPAAWAELARKAALHEEMLEALQGVTRILEAFSYTNQFGRSQRDRLNKARAAIAKAKGGQS